jgi:hypothetical protein
VDSDSALDDLLSIAQALALEEPLPECRSKSVELDEVASRTNVRALLGLWAIRAGIRDCLAPIVALIASNDRNHRLAMVAYDIANAFKEAGHLVVFRKGIDVAADYPSIGSREFHDIDLYAHSTCIEHLPEILSALGFAPVGRTRREHLFLLLATDSVTTYERREINGETIVLDPAREIGLRAMGGRSCDFLFERSATNSSDLPVLHHIDRVMDLAVNLFITHTTLRYVHQRRYSRLNQFVDLLVCTRGFSDGKLRELFERAEREGFGEAVGFAFGNLARLFPSAPIVEAILQSGLVDTASVHLDEVGQLELPTPYAWRAPMPERLLSAVPTDMPPPPISLP